MPSQASLDIVNALFAGQKDVSDYVDARMKELAFDSIDAMKKDVGAKLFASEEDAEEKETETEEPDEETTDETDNGND
jgi:hypothetical protein